MTLPEAKPVCSRCGIATDHQVADLHICEDCAIASGSCCTEFDPADE